MRQHRPAFGFGRGRSRVFSRVGQSCAERQLGVRITTRGRPSFSRGIVPGRLLRCPAAGLRCKRPCYTAIGETSRPVAPAAVNGCTALQSFHGRMIPDRASHDSPPCRSSALSEMAPGQEADLFVLMTAKEELTTREGQAVLPRRLSRRRPGGELSRSGTTRPGPPTAASTGRRACSTRSGPSTARRTTARSWRSARSAR